LEHLKEKSRAVALSFKLSVPLVSALATDLHRSSSSRTE